ncbi:MAG: efflux RND transporter permease subunit [Polyangiaceae bacterium]|nr:efflux RND transporter permease subunit [Polyangiaceae bacterium]
MAHRTDQDIVLTTHNTARYFTENRHVSWVLLVATVAWGLLSYVAMPKRKDPEVPVRVAAAVVAWPGAPAEKVEQLVTRRLEEKIAESPKILKITSTTRAGVAVVTIELDEGVKNAPQEFDDIEQRLETIHDLPAGTGPIQFLKDFGTTVALMLTVASPRPSDVEIQLRAAEIQRGIERVRREASPSTGKRASLVYAFPASIDPRQLRRVVEQMRDYCVQNAYADDARLFDGSGFLGIDAAVKGDEATIQADALLFLQERMRTSELHPDVWRPIVVFDPAETEAKLAAVAESRYSYRDLDNFTDDLQKRLEGVPEVSKVTRTGVLAERVFLDFSQERTAAYGVQWSQVTSAIAARNITVPGGTIEAQGKTLTIDPSGELASEKEIGDIALTLSPAGAPVYLRDAFEVSRDYESPPTFLNEYTRRDRDGRWQRTRAITLAISMRSGKQIGAFGKNVDAALAAAREELPEDLVVARTSDQPRQVNESISLFMTSLYEAVVLVVLVALVGFFEWRSALVLALCIPITLMMTFGLMYLLGVDLQQISIASLIIALGLLVDDPVVASDAIKRDLSLGHPPIVASWIGPTKLAGAILFATITNIVAYLPFLTLPGDVGAFIFTLPVVLTASLVASRLVSMTFIPMLAYYFLRPPRVLDPSIEERRSRGFGKIYARVAGWAIDHRWIVLVASLALVGRGCTEGSHLKQAFFPKDLSYLSYVDVWLPNDAPISATTETAHAADETIRRALAEYGRAHPGADGKPADVLRSITTFIGGGGPRFWFSVSPEQAQINYAQLVLEVNDKHATEAIVPVLQRALSAEIPGARIDVRELENGKPVGVPISFRISGSDIGVLRDLAEKTAAILRSDPRAERVRDDWGEESFQVNLRVDPDRANLAGVTNFDVARSSAGSLNGEVVGSLRDGHRLIPIVSRLRGAERAYLSDVQNLYVGSAQGKTRVPIRQISTLSYAMTTDKIQRRNHFRTITVSAFPRAGVLPSEVVDAVRPKLAALSATFPPGYKLEIGGEEEEQKKGFLNLAVVLGICVMSIFIALVVQFKNAVKPFIVFAAIPYGVAGALVSLSLMGAPFGFMAFLGIISLIGIIVSHVIVLFDFVEERHERGEPLREALIDAGILRVRPVLITVAATVFALFPLAIDGGPLWQPLCYAQIGGLTVATVITLLLVPVIYSIFVLDLKLVRWEQTRTVPPHPAVP